MAFLSLGAPVDTARLYALRRQAASNVPALMQTASRARCAATWRRLGPGGAWWRA